MFDLEFSLEELKEAKKQLRDGKAPDEDGIMPELVRRVDLDDIILKISNKFYIDNQMPEQLGIINLIPLPKSRNLSIMGNYRGIALISIVEFHSLRQSHDFEPDEAFNRSPSQRKPEWF